MKFLIFLILTLIFSCSTTNKKMSEARKSHWPSKNWYYQLQNINLSQLEQRSDSLLVIDYSKDGSEKNKFSLVDIARLKKNNNVVISYLSIGEAEKYRYYYKKMSKKLLIKENKSWKGNFIVKFWDERWKKIIYKDTDSYLKRIMAEDFDGVYLDIVDCFENFSPQPELEKKAVLMADFIRELSLEAKKLNPRFKIIIQNGTHIIQYLENKDQFLSAIDGVGVEDIYFNGDKEHDNIRVDETFLLNIFKFYKNKSIPIYSVEYLKNQQKIDQYYSFAARDDLIPLVRSRSLAD
jgi:cysteinyl-tRNA synthetase